MNIHIVAVGTRMPDWVTQAWYEYSRRMPRECTLVLKEIPLAPRSKSRPLGKAVEREGEQMLAALPRDAELIALDVRGRSWSTPQLAGRMRDWMQDGRDICLLVGGPDGLAPACLQRAASSWSLSALTLPHPMVRVLLAEQLYRAWTINAGHPYHRA